MWMAAPSRPIAGWAIAVTLSAVIALATLATAALARSKANIKRFSKSGSWIIHVVYSDTGSFSHCTASARYRSGTRVAFTAFESGLWLLQFYKSDWPRRVRTKFPARLKVDGRTVLRGNGFFRGRSAFINLGRSADRVTALMRGRVMTIRTPSGSSSFRLDGTFKAAGQVARCWNAKRNTNADAFAGNNQGAFGRAPRSGGAFGGSGSSTGTGAKVLSRGKTLDIAIRYLSWANRPYTILPSGENVLKQFPVNWKYTNGLIGGMKAYTGTGVTPQSALQRLLAQQAADCNGRSTIERQQPLTLKSGRVVKRARGICTLQSGNMLSMHYRATKLTSDTLAVIVLLDTNRQFDDHRADAWPGPNEL